MMGNKKHENHKEIEPHGPYNPKTCFLLFCINLMQCQQIDI